MSYTIEEHKHRYAAWAASRAASTKTCRFSVLQGKSIVDATGLPLLIAAPSLLPSPQDLDAKHREWRNAAIKSANTMGLNDFTHGIAAKLINVYLKGAFVCAGHQMHANVAALHPPIDSLLLDELYDGAIGGQRQVWAAARKIRWSKFNSDQYESVIDGIRIALGDSPLWHVERYWRGYQ
ncbi:hypothetical protein GTP44_07505 [Duganella sp. FT50W]|uniref:Uncharacterized protein n=1 Tax=Duganella lactea TaxID=2692173 RepID=A0A6L8MFY9_9BURK|nr:hypothetical protein [Duganella lactea]MYM81803.1 hypothetical protein [Duganella lactea]